MKRFFGTSRALLRIPPGAPAKVTQVPIPRTVRTSKEIFQYLSPQQESAPAERKSTPYMRSAFPSVDEAKSLGLNQPEGVWYNVNRTRSGNLPVYTDYNNAGGVWTEVRRIEGSVSALRADIQKALGLTRREIWMKNAAPVIVLKGNRSAELKELLGQTF